MFTWIVIVRLAEEPPPEVPRILSWKRSLAEPEDAEIPGKLNVFSPVPL